LPRDEIQLDLPQVFQSEANSHKNWPHYTREPVLFVAKKLDIPLGQNHCNSNNLAAGNHLDQKIIDLNLQMT
jgi:hypothetical protein